MINKIYHFLGNITFHKISLYFTAERTAIENKCRDNEALQIRLGLSLSGSYSK